MFPVIFKVLQFGRGDFAINLRKSLETAHRQQRVAERDDDRHTGIVGQIVPLNQPSPSSLNCRFAGVGGGGICAGPR